MSSFTRLSRNSEDHFVLLFLFLVMSENSLVLRRLEHCLEGLIGARPGKADDVASLFCTFCFACFLFAQVALSREMLLGSPSPLRRAGERRRV